MPRAPVVVLACGNPGRGDDALGPLLLDRLQTWLDERGLTGAFELIADVQWQIDNALDLAERSLALFIDAGHGTPAPFVFAPVRECASTTPLTHALSPGPLLGVLRQIGEVAPPAFVVCVAGQCFALGGGLSAAAADNANQAFALLVDLCADPCPARWQALERRYPAASGG